MFFTTVWNPYYLPTMLFSKFCVKNLFNGKVYGQENIPLLIGAAFQKRRLVFLARKTLFNKRFWNYLLSQVNIIPVDREKTADYGAVRRALSLLKNGFSFVNFPEGTRSSDGCFGAAQPGIGFLACKTQVSLIPARIFGSYKILRKNCIIPDIHQRATIVIGTPIARLNRTASKRPKIALFSPRITSGIKSEIWPFPGKNKKKIIIIIKPGKAYASANRQASRPSRTPMACSPFSWLSSPC
jgi:1-acyl-sn-glycerol-3-phosphate acyltransferase